ncbi:MAG: protein-L-isoaspartate(D-aspartate) O-methyltransferase [Burkholderiaceae bacterium]|nr:protein-L-isoaspartate(D-aspartate) O-methyltransferase [Burkholderiaceae bacterium]
MKAATANGGLASERVRERMVARLREAGIRDARVLAAMAAVPRHAFVDPALASRAYEDTALPIGHGQTISQPWIVARSAELALAGRPDARALKVLEIGTGCGYAAAVLAHVFGTVYSLERLRALHERARANVRPLRLANLHLLYGDGTLGLPACGPFDAIVVAAAAPELPEAWFAQLASGGCIVAPIGGQVQRLSVATRDDQGRVRRREFGAVHFVPLRTGVQ